jgi:hypothetical protein
VAAAHQMSIAKSQDQLKFAFQDWRQLTTNSTACIFGDHAVCMINTSIPIFGELVDRLQLSLFTFYITKLSSYFTSGNITTACPFGIVHMIKSKLTTTV